MHILKRLKLYQSYCFNDKIDRHGFKTTNDTLAQDWLYVTRGAYPKLMHRTCLKLWSNDTSYNRAFLEPSVKSQRSRKPRKRRIGFYPCIPGVNLEVCWKFRDKHGWFYSGIEDLSERTEHRFHLLGDGRLFRTDMKITEFLTVESLIMELLEIDMLDAVVMVLDAIVVAFPFLNV